MFDPSKPLSLTSSEKDRHPNSVNPDENAIVLPEGMVISRRGNEQLHVIPFLNEDETVGFRFMTYVNGGEWGGKMWYGYVSSQKARMPILTMEGVRLLSDQLSQMLVSLS